MSDRLLKESDVLRIAFQLPLVVNSVFADAVKALPSADRLQGEWILSDDRCWKTCSECGADVDVSIGLGIYVNNDEVSEMRFCPNCGARMKGE